MKEGHHMTAMTDTMVNNVNQQIGIVTDGSQFLTFSLGEELYGVDILRVQEIKGYTAVTRIPNTPPHIKGVLNLRGTIVPIVELRTLFGMPTIEYTTFTVIIVVVVQNKVMGLVVDAVSDVLTITQQEMQLAPAFGHRVDQTYVTSLAKSGDKLVALLDLDRLLLDLAVPADASQQTS
jgi:purine-binding chemotaxis protein CheW